MHGGDNNLAIPCLSTQEILDHLKEEPCLRLLLRSRMVKLGKTTLRGNTTLRNQANGVSTDEVYRCLRKRELPVLDCFGCYETTGMTAIPATVPLAPGSAISQALVGQLELDDPTVLKEAERWIREDRSVCDEWDHDTTEALYLAHNKLLELEKRFYGQKSYFYRKENKLPPNSALLYDDKTIDLVPDNDWRAVVDALEKEMFSDKRAVQQPANTEANAEDVMEVEDQESSSELSLAPEDMDLDLDLRSRASPKPPVRNNIFDGLQCWLASTARTRTGSLRH